MPDGDVRVGRVSSIDDTRDGGSPEVSVELSVDFSRIEYVYVGLAYIHSLSCLLLMK